MNLFKLIWCRKFYNPENELWKEEYFNNLSQIIEARDKLINNVKGYGSVKIPFNPYYLFNRDFDNLCPTEQFRELTLAKEIMEFTRSWDKIYYFDWNQTISTYEFKRFCSKRVHNGEYNMAKMKISCYQQDSSATIKTIANWINRLRKLKICSIDDYNTFFTLLSKDYGMNNEWFIDFHYQLAAKGEIVNKNEFWAQQLLKLKQDYKLNPKKCKEILKNTGYKGNYNSLIHCLCTTKNNLANKYEYIV